MRYEAEVTALSWIPSEAIPGATKLPFELGVAHYDEPPPERLGDLVADVEALRKADRFRFGNVLRAWVEVGADGTIERSGYSGGGVIGSTTMHFPGTAHTFQAFSLPDIQHEPEVVDGGRAIRFLQTAGGRTGVPAPRRVRRKPFVQWRAPLAWSTLALTLRNDGTSTFEVVGASRFPRHWIYDQRGNLAAKSGLTDFKDWYRKSFGKHSPWGDEDSPALVTAVETALERTLSARLMRGARKPKVRKVKEGEVLVKEGDPASEIYLLLDGVLRAEKDGERLAEYGPGAMLGERASLEGGWRTATLVAVTACRVAVADPTQMDRDELQELSTGHRHEERRSTT